MATVYDINKGINRSIEFKGIRAQYIVYLAVGMVILLLLFAILYMTGVNIYICLAIVVPGGGGLVLVIQTMSKKYGEHGLAKQMASRQLPRAIRTRSRRLFINLKDSTHAHQ
ncbi:DUF4133 domain-containing protein [Dinghuibacter silviterrae]|uniref:Uncharacterized protein DUF4133 n=1 Tax=Dinghuibacter silviterrae TaxID=1539049 RepID=A0A4R8DJC3_9BACT|nr:DUF4133 domain-containing protein [Dinghuibacter silviterrae]TDW97100.1 uncharacterized protein DUF4133 [Dinghuibacter silviterrae]